MAATALGSVPTQAETDDASGRAGVEPGRRYAFGHGFTYRREAFGGILYHYEGVRPDPRVTFLDNAFFIDLLDALAAHPDAPLADLIAAVGERFALQPPERERVRDFFATLIERGALVPA